MVANGIWRFGSTGISVQRFPGGRKSPHVGTARPPRLYVVPGGPQTVDRSSRILP